MQIEIIYLEKKLNEREIKFNKETRALIEETEQKWIKEKIIHKEKLLRVEEPK